MSLTSGQWVHMVGVAGAGMSGIAKVLNEQGFRVSGSDLQKNSITSKLEDAGIEIYQGHSADHLKEGVDLVVISSAIPADNEEVKRAREQKIPVLKRGQILAEIVNIGKGVAVAGAHGKTTTTSMIFKVLQEGGIDPSFIVGGELQESDLSAKVGNSDYFVVEADESDASFLNLRPYIAVVTNVENDHMDFYLNMDRMCQAFQEFVDGVEPRGFAIMYGEDECVKHIAGNTSTRVVFYGENSDNDYYLQNWCPSGGGSKFEIYYRSQYLGVIHLSVPGYHNALNALAAIAAGLEIGLDIMDIKTALSNFHGAKRRFEILSRERGITLIDDYAHHPTEIKATLAAARSMNPNRIMVIFQPHRYTRTKMLSRQLGEAFELADITIFTEIYAAGEEKIPEISSELIYRSALNQGYHAEYIPDNNEIIEYILKNVRENDFVIFMGAGDIWELAIKLLRKMKTSY